MFDSKTHRYLFLFGTIVITVGLPFSPLLLSIGQFILAGNWIAELGFKRKLREIISRRSILFFILLYLVHVIWLLNSSNTNYAFHDLKIKLPLLILPVIYSTTLPLNRNEFKLILHFVLTAVLCATFVSTAIFFIKAKDGPVDYRNLSTFISHIRFSLQIVLCIYIIVSMLICYRHFQILPSWIYLIILAWCILFILFLGASTGVLVLLLVSPFALFFWLNTKEGRKYKIIGIAILFSVFTIVIIYLGISFTKYQSREIVDEKRLEKYTVNGNAYSHYLNLYDYENNERVWFYVCEKELKKEWESRSDIKYDGKDKKGQNIRFTIVRYLTSLGYRKDSIGISKLTPEDVEMIENGYTNYIYKKRLAVYPRLYQLFWEMEFYFRTGNPSGHSFTQRIEYSKNALRVIQRNFWFGTGTGDVDDEIQYQYKIDNSKLNERWQFRAHNQIITLFLTFGLVGFIIILFSIYFVIKAEKQNIDFIAFTFLLIVLFSMLNEDTFETQAGASFFAFFFSLFIFGRKIVGESQ